MGEFGALQVVSSASLEHQHKAMSACFIKSQAVSDSPNPTGARGKINWNVDVVAVLIFLVGATASFWRPEPPENINPQLAGKFAVVHTVNASNTAPQVVRVIPTSTVSAMTVAPSATESNAPSLEVSPVSSISKLALPATPVDQGTFILGDDDEWTKVPKAQADYVPTPNLLSRDKAAQPAGPWQSAFWQFKSLGSIPEINGTTVALQINYFQPNRTMAVQAGNPKPLVLKLGGASDSVWKVIRYTYSDNTKGYGDQVLVCALAEQKPSGCLMTISPRPPAGYYAVLVESTAFLFQVK